MNRRAWTIVIAILAALGLGAGLTALWRANYQREERVVDAGFGPEARKNPWLALERWFQASGRPVEVRTLLPAQLPPPGDTLILVERFQPMPRGKAEALRAWVAGGGRLVFACDLEHRPGQASEPGSATQADQLPQVFGLDFVCTEGQAGEPAAPATPATSGMPAVPATPPAPATPATPASPTQDIFLPHREDEPPFRILMNAHHFLQYEEDPGPATLKNGKDGQDAEEDDGLRLCRVRTQDWGQGSLLAFTELGFLDNTALGRYDHAEFFHELLGPSTGRVWIVRGDRPPTLWNWLQEKGRPAGLAGAVFLLLLLWRLMPRFGPLRPGAQPVRRSLMEHVSATGRFLWKEGQWHRLTAGARGAAQRRLALSRPSLQALPEDQLVRQLALATGLPEGAIRRALSRTDPETPRDYTETIRTFETLRKTL